MDWLRRHFGHAPRLGMLVAIGLWLLFVLTRGGALPDMCIQGFGDFDLGPCRAGFNTRTDLYSIIDPASVSPLQRQAWERAIRPQWVVPSWLGIAWVPDELVMGNMIEVFSWLSFGLFLLVTIVPVLVLSMLRRSNVRTAVMVGLLTWYALESLRWWYVLWSLGGMYGYDIAVAERATWLVVTAVLSPWLVGCLLFRRRARHIA